MSLHNANILLQLEQKLSSCATTVLTSAYAPYLIYELSPASTKFQ